MTYLWISHAHLTIVFPSFLLFISRWREIALSLFKTEYCLHQDKQTQEAERKWILCILMKEILMKTKYKWKGPKMIRLSFLVAHSLNIFIQSIYVYYALNTYQEQLQRTDDTK